MITCCKPILVFSFFFLNNLLLNIPIPATSLTFTIPSISTGDNSSFNVFGDAQISPQGLQLTPNPETYNKVGRAMYTELLHLWDAGSGKLANFNTHFSFVIESKSESYGEGLAFFLADPLHSVYVPTNSSTSGGYMGLMGQSSSAHRFVAVEFDPNGSDIWDAGTGPHVGVDISNIKSTITTYWNSLDAIEAEETDAWVIYDASSYTLTVYFRIYDMSRNRFFTKNLSYVVDLRDCLPEYVSVGFSAATGRAFAEVSYVKSWDFSSTALLMVHGDQAPVQSPKLLLSILQIKELTSKLPVSEISLAPLQELSLSPMKSPSLSAIYGPSLPPASNGSNQSNKKKKRNLALAIGLSVGLYILVSNFLFWGWFIWKIYHPKEEATGDKSIAPSTDKELEKGTGLENLSRKDSEADDPSVAEADKLFDPCLDKAFEEGVGPKKYSYMELVNATKNFEESLGRGGFGEVYKGSLGGTMDIAVKRLKKDSNQGMKEYESEVKIISQLRHKNLVPLLGWCHETREVLLAYKFMPNGSLDDHLFREDSILPWEVRYEIARGLASALLYLHEECEQCVLNRDIKSSNVMLDSKFNARLGDFGLARLVDHEQASKTTELAGTIGYMAPEYIMMGRATKASDVYSFGVVLLEIACGTKAIAFKGPGNPTRLVQWISELYTMGKPLDAADPKLCQQFNEQEMEKLMVIGLWCVHPDDSRRPSMKRVVSILNFDSPLSISLSLEPLTASLYHTASMNMPLGSTTESSGTRSTLAQSTGANSPMSIDAKQ